MNSNDEEPQRSDEITDDLCFQQPQLMNIYFMYIFPVLCILSALTVCICTAFYIAAFLRNKLKISVCMFSLTTFFFLTTLLNYVSWTIMSMHYCGNPLIFTVSVPISLILNITKGLLLVAILFRTVRRVFKGTPFALSTCTVICFRTLFVLSCVFIICGATMFPLHRWMLGFALSGSSQTLLNILSIYLLSLFIHKLLQTYRGMDGVSDDVRAQQLVYIITKIALLFSIATCTRIAVTAVQASLVSVLNVHYTLFSNVLILADLQTDFFCIFLCFKHFDAVYTKLCGICDRCCRGCWTRCARQTKDEKMMIKEMQSVAVQPRKSVNVSSSTPRLSTVTKSEMTSTMSAMTSTPEETVDGSIGTPQLSSMGTKSETVNASKMMVLILAVTQEKAVEMEQGKDTVDVDMHANGSTE